MQHSYITVVHTMQFILEFWKNYFKAKGIEILIVKCVFHTASYKNYTALQYYHASADETRTTQRQFFYTSNLLLCVSEKLLELFQVLTIRKPFISGLKRVKHIQSNVPWPI